MAPNTTPQRGTHPMAHLAKKSRALACLVALGGMVGAVGSLPASAAGAPNAAPQPTSIPGQETAEHVVVLSKSAQAVRREVTQVGEARFSAPDYKPGVIEHIVLFAFKPTATPAQRHEVTRRFLALAQQTRRPDGTLVIKSLEAGPQSSGEGADLGLDYGYVVRFASAGDRNYYVGRPLVQSAGHFDPAHDAFKAFAAPYLANVVVFDFTPTP